MPSSRHRNRFLLSVAFFFFLEKFKKQDEQSPWEPVAEVQKARKGLLLTDNSSDLVCQCIKGVMPVCCFFVCDAVFRCTLEKLTYLCCL